MFSDVPEMFSNVPEIFSDVLRMPSIDQRYSIEILRFVQDVPRCSQMFTDVLVLFLQGNSNFCFARN